MIDDDQDTLRTRTDADGGTHHALHSDDHDAPGELAAPIMIDLPAVCTRVLSGDRFSAVERSSVAVVVHAWTKRDLRSRNDAELARAYLAIETPTGARPTLASASSAERIAYESAAKRSANAWRANTNTTTPDEDS